MARILCYIRNYSVTSPKSDNRTPLNGDQLKVEIEDLQQKVDIVGIVYCVREGAPDVYNKLEETEIPVLHIVKNLLSLRKQKAKKVLKKYSKFHLDPLLELKTLFTIAWNNGYLKRILWKILWYRNNWVVPIAVKNTLISEQMNWTLPNPCVACKITLNETQVFLYALYNTSISGS